MFSKIKIPFLQLFNKTQNPSRFINLILMFSSLCIIYLLSSLFLVGTSKIVSRDSSQQDVYEPTSLEHIVFGIGSNNKSWSKRKEYVKLWWKPNQMRGCVFLESMPPDSNSSIDSSPLPPVCVSGDTSRFRYTYRGGLRSAIRVARVVSETVALNHSDVRWFVFGDDDTVFFPENLVKTLSKYDHELWYYIGSNSEIFEQNRFFGFHMAFGGAGFAISYPLAKVLAKTFDSCIERYPHLYGSDSRVFSCLTELGVGLTHEPGFHQVDVRGDISGLLASHPLTPLVSLHHLDLTNPIFPNMTTMKALEHLLKATSIDSQRILQQTVCYDPWFSWTISVSWGYAIQVHSNHLLLPDALPVQATFRPWKKSGNALAGAYAFKTKQLHPDPCRRPTAFFFDDASSDGDGIQSKYKKAYQNCSYDMGSPRKLEEIKVFSTKLDLGIKQVWLVVPFFFLHPMKLCIRKCQD
ncbi:hypothetical protein HS088_TW22G00112 [Tripterygium wilfordii]|uniref:Transferring glycosyl group transferase n=1 Tax=Tripterygium wilfordii TaxID=458696 RepID=A0A7J7BX46_TRIWF|nr:hypothetical protein HS088_TW22G00112 [Tripterygium wilfordii]